VIDDASASRLDVVMVPQPRRVIVKLFVPGEDAAMVRSRAHALVDRIATMDAGEAGKLLEETFERFDDRHRDLADTFRQHYEIVRHHVDDQANELSPDARLLIGAYFTHEYAVEAAALCNPSIVAHPDQSGLAEGQLRVVISLRQIGEGHLSSIGFATAVIGPGERLDVADRSGPLVTGRRADARYRRDLLVAGLADEDRDDEVSATVLGALPADFDAATLERAISAIPADLRSRPTAQRTLELLRRTNDASYATTFPADTLLHQRVLWPATHTEANGMEDARFVRYVDDDGTVDYRATYTAYDGRRIASRLLCTDDLRRFQMTPMRGPGARNKGVALFPRSVNGRRLALCRSDGQTTGLTALDDDSRWQAPVPLQGPYRGWELIQVGNCGSPIETDAGWLVLTHGVGPMRRYAMGALLLALQRPERLIAELRGPLLAPEETERDGYVPNIVYSCGGLLHAGAVWIPYGISDCRVGFAVVPLDSLLAAMTSVHGSTS
jgi:predicted GH43/DUF377 family glycosyl hydrolase